VACPDNLETELAPEWKALISGGDAFKLRNKIAGSPFCLSPSTKHGVPHISLVFREMWDTTALHLLLSKVGKEANAGLFLHRAQ
jgi:hypothetical protein